MRISSSKRGLKGLIASSRSWSVARDISLYSLSSDEYGLVLDLATDYLRAFPVLPGACVMMSAGFVSQIRQRTGIPAAVVAGALEVDGTRYFHTDAREVTTHPLNGSTLEWDGHAWALVGDHVVDLSIFRTAYSGYGPIGLREKMMLRFGPGCGAFIAKLRKAPLEGMEYDANYVLSEEQELAFAIGAKAIVEHAGSEADRLSALN